METVLRELPRHIELTRAEPGCGRFVVERTVDPLIWKVSERFVDHESFDAHQERVRSSEWGRATSAITREYVVTSVADELTVRFGGASRVDTMDLLQSAGVQLNAYAETLLAHPIFDSPPEEMVRVTQRTPADLGLSQGGTLTEILEAGRAHDLRPVPLAAAPTLRLMTLSQEGAPDSVLSAGRPPTAAIHIASEPVSEDDEYPKGFYLRVVDGVPWLRGYRSDATYVMEPDQEYFFARLP